VPCAQEVKRHDGIKALIHLLGSESEGVQSNAAGALFNCAYTGTVLVERLVVASVPSTDI
jgi:hypothetical protein